MKQLLGLAACLLIIILPGTSVRAELVEPCSPGESILYYVLWGRPVAPFNELNTYTAPFRFVQELKPRPGYGIIEAVCSTQQEKFENLYQISQGPAIGASSELYQVLDAGSGTVVGTLWHDEKEPYDQGGAVAYVRYRTCQVPAGINPPNPLDEFGVINDVGFWSYGLGVEAMNDADAASVEQFWLGPIRQMVESVADTYMQGWPMLCGSKMDMQSFMVKYQGEYAWRDYLQIDPDGGIMGKPSL